MYCMIVASRVSASSGEVIDSQGDRVGMPVYTRFFNLLPVLAYIGSAREDAHGEPGFPVVVPPPWCISGLAQRIAQWGPAMLFCNWRGLAS